VTWGVAHNSLPVGLHTFTHSKPKHRGYAAFTKHKKTAHFLCGFLWWTWLQPSPNYTANPLCFVAEIHTIAEISLHIKMVPVKEVPVYQKRAKKVKQLKALGMPFTAIAESLRVDTKTAIKAQRFQDLNK
jgi:hypothetical protein